MKLTILKRFNCKDLTRYLRYSQDHTQICRSNDRSNFESLIVFYVNKKCVKLPFIIIDFKV